MPQCSFEVTITNRLGLHARPSMWVVDIANKFTSTITIVNNKSVDGEPIIADGKSVMQVIVLAAFEGTVLSVTAEGDDAEEACRTLKDVFENQVNKEVPL